MRESINARLDGRLAVLCSNAHCDDGRWPFKLPHKTQYRDDLFSQGIRVKNYNVWRVVIHLGRELQWIGGLNNQVNIGVRPKEDS